MPMGIKERKEREKEARREEIIGAAEKVFFEKGLAAATMDEIAEAAELSKGTLYLYHPSKEDLFLAVCLRGTHIMYSMFEQAVSTGEPSVILIRNLGDAYYDYFLKHRDYFRTMYVFENPSLQKQVSPEMLEQCAQDDKRIWGLVIQTIKRAIDDGLLRKDIDPMEAGVILWSNEHGILRLIDRQETYWREQMGINLEATLRKSTRLLMEAMMTDKGRKMYLSHNKKRKT
jgi:AcrR family transcriptional regulator